ncbi:MAG TPA: hypothetical protein VGL89_11135 [Candidatus Koribacter sp.]
MKRRFAFEVVVVLLFAVAFAGAQTEAPKPPPPRPLSLTARLTAAKTVFLKNGGGSDVPFNIISDGIQGWGRYQVVDSPDKADIVVEVTSPQTDKGVSVTSKTTTDPQTGYPSQSTSSSHEFGSSRISVVVRDAKSKMTLWAASETPKSALREKARNDNVVEASQDLLRQFRERVEPDLAK